ncbi:MULTISPECIES: hypothetical protein [Nocardia]|uniref:hypothetical protein n=1 Tax=Nocardia TaxID=1817 RepID=UPI0012F6509E|nr:hypothetical protein [Nocardia araoensis]
MRDPETLTGDDNEQLNQILARCPELATTRRHIGAFAVMMRDRRGDPLSEWMDQSAPTTFPRCIRSRPASSTISPQSLPGSPCPGSNGPTVGTVNKVKALKQQCFV